MRQTLMRKQTSAIGDKSLIIQPLWKIEWQICYFKVVAPPNQKKPCYAPFERLLGGDCDIVCSKTKNQMTCFNTPNWWSQNHFGSTPCDARACQTPQCLGARLHTGGNQPSSKRGAPKNQKTSSFTNYFNWALGCPQFWNTPMCLKHLETVQMGKPKATHVFWVTGFYENCFFCSILYILLMGEFLHQEMVSSPYQLNWCLPDFFHPPQLLAFQSTWSFPAANSKTSSGNWIRWTFRRSVLESLKM